MQITRPNSGIETNPKVEEKLLTRPFPGWVNTANFLWLIAILAALVAGAYLLVARPVTSRTWDAANLTNTVPEKNDYGLYAVEPGNFVWTHPKALVIIPASTHTDRQVTVTFRARGASAGGGPVNNTKVSANGVPVGEISPKAGNPNFQDFTFTFVPADNDKTRINLQLETPAWQPKGDPRQLGLMLQAVSVNMEEVWSPLLMPGRAWIIWLLPALALLLMVVRLAQRAGPESGNLVGWTGVGLSLLASALMAAWFFLIARVGYNGELNHTLYWLYVVGASYLAVFFAWLAIAGWRVLKNPSGEAKLVLLDWAELKSAGWRSKHPVITAFGVILLFNLALTAIFAGKIALQNGSIAPIFRYLDGPEYVVIANNFYDPNEPLIRPISDFSQHSPFYWAAHFPGFSVALMLLKPLVGWLWAPLTANFIFSTAFAWVFYRLVRDFNYARHPLWLALVALVLPVRWLIYHNVGGSEPLFMFLEVLSLYWFKKQRYWLAGLAGFGAIFTRPPGIFLWIGFMLLLLFEAAVRMWNERGLSLAKLLQSFNWRAFVALLLIPLGLVAVFGIYAWRYGDFWAYFKITENVTHVGWIPFPTLLTGLFESPALIYTYILSAVGLVLLWRQRRYDVFWISFAAFFYTLFLLHSDVLRYSLPFFALIVLIPMADYASSKPARWLALPVLVALFFYSWGAFDRNLLAPESFDLMKQILSIKMR